MAEKRLLQRTSCVHIFPLTSLLNNMVFESKYGIVGSPSCRAWMLKLVHCVLHHNSFNGSGLDDVVEVVDLREAVSDDLGLGLEEGGYRCGKRSRGVDIAERLL